MRVARIIARMNVGGPAVQVTGLSKALQQAPGVQHVLITGQVGEDEQDYLDAHGRGVHVLRVPELGRAVDPWDDAVAFARVTRLLRRLRPDIVHTHTAKAGVVGRAAARLAVPRARVVHTYHGHLLHGYFPPAKTRAVIAVERGFARGSAALVTVGAQVRDDLLAAGIGRPQQYRVIPPGIPPLVVGDRATAKAELGIDPAAVVVSFVGRLTAIKRPDRFCDVVRRVAATTSAEVVFLVAGDGSEAAYVRQRAADEQLPIQMLGWVEQVAPVFAASDLTLLTSDNEGTPISLVQAGMAGVPAIATDVGSVREIVADGITGLVRPTEADDLAAATASLIADPAARRKLGDAAIEHTRRFTTDALADAHLELYRQLLGARGGRPLSLLR